MPALKRFFALALLAALPALAARAQEFRGSISGRVTEASGAAVPNATVTVTNTGTNTSSTATTNDSGDYVVPYLTPGGYRVTVEAAGFKKSLRQDIEIRVGDKLALDFALEVGQVQETVNVTSDAPLLDTASASAGQVIDRRRISELPLSDGNPFVLTRLAPGIAYTGDLLFSRPFDNGGTSSIVADGAPGGNEFTLDGTPNQASGRRVAFVPPADAVQEFKVETASFDGQQSHTAGATVNVTLRSGENQFHGTAYEFVRNDILSANNFFNNRNAPFGRDADGKAKRDVTRYNRYGGTIGGPVVLPRFGTGGSPTWVGRNRSFFFFAYEGLKDAFQEPGFFTVPTLAMRQGDFSALLPSIVIYDPATAVRRADGRVERRPFAGNIIPQNRFSPIALNYLRYYPLPNVTTANALGQNNYFSSNPRTDDFHSESGRFDQTLSDRQKFFVRYSHNYRKEARGNWTGEVNGIRPTGNFLFRINHGANFDHVYNLSPTTILNTRVGFSRFIEQSARQHQGQFSPASLGFSAATAAFFGDASYFPRFEIGGLSFLGDSVGDTTTFNIYSFQPTLTKLVSSHSVRAGVDFRSYRENGIPTAQAAGRYDFGNDFTRQLDTSPGVAGGQQFAAFLLGQPTGGFIDRNTARSNQSLYLGLFAHDDWKVTPKLTLNLGLRYEYEGATDERFNRNIIDFDRAVTNPIEAAAKAAYTNPIPELPASAFNVRGGLLFAGDDRRGFWDADKNNVQPRVGVAYQLSEKTVVRGGYGVYTVPFIIAGVNQQGFSQATNIVPTADVGVTFRATLLNPFPTGVLGPPGASLGLRTFTGRDITFTPRNLRNPQTHRWQVGVQRELPGQWVVEASYVGNRGVDVTTGTINNLLNAVPRQYLSTSPIRDQTTINFLNATFANPFRGLATPGTGLNDSANISRAQLLRPFPAFGNIGAVRNDGSTIYHAGQFRAEKRFTKGYTLLTAYTWSKYIEQVSVLNDFDADLERRISRDDVPHRVVLSGIFELPFGKGRKWGDGWNRAVDTFLGGWQAQAIWQWQSGRPIDLQGRNVVYFGDPSRLTTDITSRNADPTRTVFNTSGFYFTDAAVQTNGVVDPAKQRNDPRIQLSNNVRTFPSRFSSFRGQPLNLWDMSVIKNVRIVERLQLQLRAEFLNAFNHVQFNDPETNQANLPRNVQLGVKLIF
jgi:hypothetical protein